MFVKVRKIVPSGTKCENVIRWNRQKKHPEPFSIEKTRDGLPSRQFF
jgi:hypothetical protein